MDGSGARDAAALREAGLRSALHCAGHGVACCVSTCVHELRFSCPWCVVRLRTARRADETGLQSRVVTRLTMTCARAVHLVRAIRGM